jgi:sugar O-acyltransferase (sialic acid O-acetyltransferase NeuD family)
MIKKNNLEKIIIIGASGFGREVLQTILDCNKKLEKYQIVGFLDSQKSLKNKKIDGYSVLGGDEWFTKKNVTEVKCVIAIGDNKIRKKISEKLVKKNVIFSTIIHPTVIFPKNTKIGKGTIIQAGVIITVNVKIKNHVHINIGSTVGHDSVIEDNVTISPGTHVNGHGIIKKNSFIGTGVIIKENILIGESAIIGAGTVLLENVPKNSMYVGIPGKLKQKRQ